MVPTTISSGMKNPTASSSVSTVVAAQRRPPNMRWSRRSTGHVATAMVPAQRMAGRNGAMIQTLTAAMAASPRITATRRIRSS